MRKENEDMELLCMIGCFFSILIMIAQKIVDVFMKGIIGIFKVLEGSLKK